MLRFVNYDIVFQEIPGEVTLAINISNCPHKCKGCHSPYLRKDVGEILDEKSLAGLLEKYENAITCVCFMGGDANPKRVLDLAVFTRSKTNNKVKTGWYSGNNTLLDESFVRHFNYMKIGAYDEKLGGLNSPETNQRFYRIDKGKMIDETCFFRKK